MFSYYYLPEDQIADEKSAYEKTILEYSQPYLDRRRRGKKHPVEDFLFTYYSFKPAQLLRWHPGVKVTPEGHLQRPVFKAGEHYDPSSWRFYRQLSSKEEHELSLVFPTIHKMSHEKFITFDLEEFLVHRGSSLAFIHALSSHTRLNPANFSCFGLHEWAMVYQQDTQEHRHEYLSLRLSQEATNHVVEGHKIRCSHIDAFRFFTPPAVGLNELQPSRQQQRYMEHPGCIHANMDLYKWAYKLVPFVPSSFVLETLQAAWDMRIMDMQASPYDLVEWGYQPIPIETTQGKNEYVKAQRHFAQHADILRQKLIKQIDPVTDSEFVIVKADQQNKVKNFVMNP